MAKKNKARIRSGKGRGPANAHAVHTKVPTLPHPQKHQLASAQAYFLAASAGLLFVFVLLKNAWLCDDIYIGLRQIEQLFDGNGLRWNPHERIQLFTSVIGFFLTAFGRLLTDDYFLNYAAQAVFFNALVLALLALLLRTPGKWGAAVLLLTASNSFMDYSWSGLHNFVGHALLACFMLLWRGFASVFKEPASKARAAFALAALAGIAPLFRHDFALIIWPPVFYALWTMRNDLPIRSLAGAVAVALLPLVLWTLFSLLYFGFPFPLTAYTKLGGGISRLVWLNNGLLYFLFTLKQDAITLVAIFAALLWLLFRGGSSGRALAAGAALHLFYTFYSGADYMGGRFFTYVYFLAVVILVDNWEAIAATLFPQKATSRGKTAKATFAWWWRSALGPTAIAVLWMIALPHTPLKSPLYYGEQGVSKKYAGGITDERASYHYASNILNYIAFRSGEHAHYPNERQVALGAIAARSTAPVLHVCNMGLTPFNARLDQKFIDIYGYSDVLQSRLPALNSRPGHLIRRLPPGYLESVATDDAVIAYSELNEYYRKLRLVTQGKELLSADRLAAILAVNTTSAPVGRLRQGPVRRMSLFCVALHDAEAYEKLDKSIEILDADTLNRSDLSQ